LRSPVVRERSGKKKANKQAAVKLWIGITLGFTGFYFKLATRDELVNAVVSHPLFGGKHHWEEQV